MYTKYIIVTSDEKGRLGYRLNLLSGDQSSQDTNWNEGDKLVNYQFVQNRMSKLMGRVLTIVDASIVDKSQNKAIKDLIKGEFIEEYTELTEMLFDKSYLERVTTDVPDAETEEVTTDEELGVK